MKRAHKIIAATILAAIGPAMTLTGCEPAEFAVDDAIAQWKGREATVWTYDNNSGQTTASITGNSVYPFRNTTSDVHDGDSTKKGSVMSISVGNNIVDIVGSSTLICETGVALIPRENIDIAVTSTDPATPWLNVLKRRFSDLFTGQERLAVIKTQNDVPVAAFTGDSVVMNAGNSDIPNSTWFKIQDNGKSRYCFAYRVNYMAIDAAML
jgi:hypothetical protein